MSLVRNACSARARVMHTRGRSTNVEGGLANALAPASAIAARLQRTARDIGKPGADSRYGHGLLDAPAALRGTPSQPARTLGP